MAVLNKGELRFYDRNSDSRTNFGSLVAEDLERVLMPVNAMSAFRTESRRRVNASSQDGGGEESIDEGRRIRAEREQRRRDSTKDSYTRIRRLFKVTRPDEKWSKKDLLSFCERIPWLLDMDRH